MEKKDLITVIFGILLTIPFMFYVTLSAEGGNNMPTIFGDNTTVNTPSSNSYGLVSDGVYILQDKNQKDANGDPVTLLIDSHDFYRLADAIDNAINNICK